MNNLYKDILIGMVFMIGLLCFISGEFIISSTLFASAAIAGNIKMNNKNGKASQFSWY